MNDKPESFTYEYSSEKNGEIERIRKKYLPEAEDGLAQLRRLDKSAEKPGKAAGITLGVAGLLLFGWGMSMCLSMSGGYFVPGVVIGVVGIVLICLAYPVYSRVTKKRREKIAPEILRLTDELMK